MNKQEWVDIPLKNLQQLASSVPCLLLLKEEEMLMVGPVVTLWKLAAAIIFTKNVKFQHLIRLLCSTVSKIWVYEICKSYTGYFDFIYILHILTFSDSGGLHQNILNLQSIYGAAGGHHLSQQKPCIALCGKFFSKHYLKPKFC